MPHLFTSLSTFSGAPFFGMDEMHLVARGIGQLLFDLLHHRNNSKFQVEASNDYTFQFDQRKSPVAIMAEVSLYIGRSTSTVPRTFEGRWNDRLDNYRAVDWQDWLLYIIPTIVLQYIDNEQTKKAIMNLVNGCVMSLERELTADDLVRLDRYSCSIFSYHICVVFINSPFVNIDTSLNGTTSCDVKSTMVVSTNVCLR